MANSLVGKSRAKLSHHRHGLLISSFDMSSVCTFSEAAFLWFSIHSGSIRSRVTVVNDVNGPLFSLNSFCPFSVRSIQRLCISVRHTFIGTSEGNRLLIFVTSEILPCFSFSLEFGHRLTSSECTRSFASGL